MQNNKKVKHQAMQKPKPAETKAKNPKRKLTDTLHKNSFSTARVIVFLLVLVFILYGNTIPNKYSFDDDLITYKNSTIKKGFRALPEIFKTHYASNSKQDYEYRPIVKATYAIEYALFKDNPHVSHFINVLLYFVLCVVLYLLLRKLLKSYHPWIALLTVVLFAVHPIHTEVVASLKNRDEMLSLTFAFLSLYLLVKFSETRKWFWIPIALVSLVFGYYSKESLLVFIAIIPLTLYFFTNEKISNLIWITALLVVSIIIMRILPHTFLPKGHREILYFENPLFFERGVWIRFGTALVVLLFYLKMLVFPNPLLFYYGYNIIPVGGPGNIWAILSLIICLALFIIALIYFKRKHLLSFSILYFFISISEFSNIVKPPPGIVAERFLLGPSLGFCLALIVVAMMIFKIDILRKDLPLKNLKKPLWLLVLIIIPFGIRTIARNPNWKDYQSLYSHDMKHLGNSAKANSLYGHFSYEEAFRSKDQKTAEKLAAQSVKFYKRALQIYPNYITCWNNLGVVYTKCYNDTTNALNCFKKAVSLDNEYAEAILNIGLMYEQENHLDSAELYYKRTLQLKTDDPKVYSQLSNLFYKQGNLQKAIDVNHRLMQAIPSSDEPYINIGNYYLLQKDTVNAIAFWEKAIEKQPGNPNLTHVLSNYFRAKGNLQKADYYGNLEQQSGRNKRVNSN